MHSFMAIVETHGLDSGTAQHSITHTSDGTSSPSCMEVPDVVAPADAASFLGETRESAGESSDSGPLFPFVSVGASSIPEVSASVSSESLVSQVQSEAAAEDGGSAFAFLSS